MLNRIRVLSVTIFCACLFSMPLAAYAAMQTLSAAKIYDLKDRNKHLYNLKNEFELTGDTKKMVATYTDPDGKLLVQETTILKVADGRESLVSYDLDHKQIGATGKIEVRDGRAYFTYTKDGKTKTANEKVGDDFVVSTMIVGYLGRNWEKIRRGETLKVRLGVVDRLETVGFSKKKAAESGEILKVKMSATSMIIAALVDPLYWGMALDGSHIKEYEGRLPVKTVAGSKVLDFDGFVLYEPQASVADAAK